MQQAAQGRAVPRPLDQAFAGGTEPGFAFEHYFLGQTRGYGLLHDRGGAIRRKFVVDITGVRAGEALCLFEVFAFDDGERLNREWTVRQHGPQRYQATAPDVIGEATGEDFSHGARWRYMLRVPVGGRQWAIAMDDWMYAIPDEVVLSRVRMSKWGLTVASMTVSYRRMD